MKRYSIQLVSVISVLLLAIAMYNYLVDPYDVFGSKPIPGLNVYKPELERYSRLGKPYQLRRQKPKTVLLASSRGLVVTDDMIGEAAVSPGTAYNASLPSGSTYEQLRMMQHALEVSEVDSFVLALDEDFTASVQPNFNETRFRGGDGEESEFVIRLKDMFFSLLSLNALKSSMRTVRKQSASPDALGDDYMAYRVNNAGGHRKMFREMEASLLASADNIIQPETCDRHPGSAEDIEKYGVYFEQMVESAYRQGIDLVIYISPVHARLYEVRCMTGRWQMIESMKRYVVSTVESLARANDRDAFQVWDFSGYNDMTTEPVPVEGDVSTTMQWYWEGSHYTREHAAIVFDTIAGRGDGRYGRRIDTVNIDPHLEAIRRARYEYLESNRQDIEDIRRLADQLADE